MFIDSIVKGLPIPIIFLRTRQNLKNYSARYEVVDGQQRLRTLFSYIDPSALPDFEPAKDEFVVLKAHNKEIGGLLFAELDPAIQGFILGYELSTHVLAPDTADEVVLRIFARMNSTGAKLNAQELRNSQFYGYFKTLSYDLAFGTLLYWRKWKVFDDDNFARMIEVETTSDILVSMMNGLSGKSQALLDRMYKDFDDELTGSEVLASRFQRVVTELDDSVGEILSQTTFRRSALFFSVFIALYDHMYGLGSDFKKKRTAKQVPGDLKSRLEVLDQKIGSNSLPDIVLDALVKATADTGRRTTRHKYLMQELSLAPA